MDSVATTMLIMARGIVPFPSGGEALLQPFGGSA
jgi:hypothetical protein